MMRAIILISGLLLCVFWFFLFLGLKGNQFHMHIDVDSKTVGVWLLGWVLILGVTYILIRKKK